MCLRTGFVFRWFRQRLQNMPKRMYKSEKDTLFVPNHLSSTISTIPCLLQEQVSDQQDGKSTENAIVTRVQLMQLYACRRTFVLSVKGHISVFLSVWPWQCGSRLVLCCSCWPSPVWMLTQGPRSTCVDLISSMPSTWSVGQQASFTTPREMLTLLWVRKTMFLVKELWKVVLFTTIDDNDKMIKK